MSFRTNIIVGWVLAAIFVGLGLSLVAGKFFHSERPEKMGYPIEGVVEASAEGAGPAAPEVPIATLLATADAAKGAEVFKKCTSCHTVEQGGANGIGPNLWGTVGEAIAQGKGGYAFSDVLKGKGGTWTFDELNKWLTNPRSYASGTKMSFAGLANGQDRANVILYLNTQGSNLPLPTPEAAPAAAPAAEGNATAPAAEGNATAPAK
ncbi:MAG: cytochrome c family protein [Sphingomonas sp.]|nr:cytochrome c family protein [Sphingomonas sp.]